MTFSSLDHYMTEVVSNIELRFGMPSTEEKQEQINHRAIEWDLSIEKTLLYDFESMFTDTWMRKDRENLFELLFLIASGENVKCPKISFGSYLNNGFRYPKVTIYGDYFDKVGDGGRVWANDEMINFVGNEIDVNFDYEYVDFLRIRQ